MKTADQISQAWSRHVEISKIEHNIEWLTHEMNVRTLSPEQRANWDRALTYFVGRLIELRSTA